MSKKFWLVMLAVVSLALLVQACTKATPAQPTAAPTQASGAPSSSAPAGQADAAAGVVLYTRNCSFCHGVQGEGVNAPALRNNQAVQSNSAQTLAEIIGNGVPGTAMPGWLLANGGPLTAAQIADVAAFLHAIQGVAPMPTATAVPPEPTETPLPSGAPTPEPAQPSALGGPGEAATMAGDAARGMPAFGLYCAGCHGPQGVLGIPNPDSDDGAVPELNPVDPTIANADSRIFATNLDLFIEHGSVPAGPGPRIAMPAFGDDKLLTPQQIADVIAYVMSLNVEKK